MDLKQVEYKRPKSNSGDCAVWSECSSDSTQSGDVPHPAVWKIVVVQLIYFMGISLTLVNFPLAWSDTILANGDFTAGGSWHSLALLLNATAEFLSASFLGVLSDKFGRKPFLVLALLGQVIDFMVCAFASNNRSGEVGPLGINYERRHQWLFASRTIAGLLGNTQIFTKAYVGDTSSPRTASRNFALLGACVGSSMICCVPLGSMIAKRLAPRILFVLAASMNALSICFVLLFLPESLQQENRKAIQWKRANPIGLCFFLTSARFLSMFAVMAFLDQFSLQLMQAIIVNYAAAVYNKVGFAVTLVIVVFAICQVFAFAVVVRLLVQRRGEIFVVKLGYAISTVAFAAMALASYTPVWALMYICAAVLAFGQISGPTQTGVASRCVGESEQGTFQAANGSLDVLAKMAAAAVAAVLFEPVVDAGQPGVIWWVASAAMVGGVWTAFRFPGHLPPTFEDVGGPLGSSEGSASQDSEGRSEIAG